MRSIVSSNETKRREAAHQDHDESDRMIRIAYCGEIDMPGYTLGEALEECARNHGHEECELTSYENPIDLVDAVVHPKTEDLIDLIVCGVGLQGMQGIEVVRDIRDRNGSIGIVLCSEFASDAYEALARRADGFLLQPTTRERFDAAVGRAIERVAAYHASSIVVKGREGMQRIRFSQFVYSETSDHDQVIHLSNGKVCSVRSSSQAFFDQLSHDPRFFKAGSSYIVNIKMVRFVDSRSSTARLADGTVVTVPVRVRKSLEDAVLAS